MEAAIPTGAVAAQRSPFRCLTGTISPRAIGRRSDANNAPKAARAGDRGFETGQKTGTSMLVQRYLENSGRNVI